MQKLEACCGRTVRRVLAGTIGMALRRLCLCMVLASLALSGGAALAQGKLKTGTSGMVRYASGGSSVDERAALETMRADFNLRLNFAVADTGVMLANVTLAIEDVRQGQVFTLAGGGPQVWLKLPPGTYAVSATSKGVEQRRRVTLDRSGEARELFFYWIPERSNPGLR